MIIEQLREELIKDIVSYIEEKTSNINNKHVRPKGGKKIDVNLINEDSINVQNTITQIIVDSFDEYEYNNQQAKLYTEDIKTQDRELNKKYK